MTSDARRLVRPGAVASWSPAQTATYQYCQVTREDYDAPFAIFKIEDGTQTLAEDDDSDEPPESFSSASSVFSLKKVEKKSTEPSKTN